MNLKNEFEPIRLWAEQRGLYQKGNPNTQFIKLAEETGELSRSILTNNIEEFSDAIGDCVVVLANLAAMKGLKIEDCINSAFKEISERKGRMENGTFVKDN